MMTSNFSNINALVIDTNSSMRQIMVSMLRAMGMQTVIVANSESQCINLIAPEKINLVICGWSAPKLNALSLLKKLRSDEKTIQIPFVIVSTIIEQSLIKEAVLNGVSEYVVPPFNKQIFEQRIAKAVKIPIQNSAKNITQKINAKRFVKKEASSELSVLIVDDIVDNIEIVKEVIKSDYRVKAATNANSALKICLSDSPPDIILLDIMMPEIDGLTLCKKLKENPLTQNIVVIFLTALAENNDVVKGLSLGAVDYITKPIVPEIVLARLKVHSTIVFNQRVIQSQIDHLLQYNELNAKAQHLIQTDIHNVMDSSKESIASLELKLGSSRQFQSTVSELKYSLGVSELLFNKANTFEQLEQKSYRGKQQRNELSKTVTSVTDIFDIAAANKNIECFHELPYNMAVTCDENLLKVILTCLYRNAIEAAPRGSKVSVTAKSYPTFILLQIHNINPIAEEFLNSFEQLFISSKGNNGNGIGVYLAFKASKALTSELYYHSSLKHGTSFYLKIPRKAVT